MSTQSGHTGDIQGLKDEHLSWIGRSGRRYALTRVLGEGYVMASELLYVLIEEGRIVWVGTAANIIEDQTSRARFRRAGTQGAQLAWLAAPEDELALMTLAWDLDGTRCDTDRDAA